MTIQKTGVMLLLMMFLLGMFAGASLAESKYVTDKLQVTIRSGPSLENKVIHVARSGDLLEVLAAGEEGWTKVRTQRGIEGWMMGRYLQNDMPAMVKLKDVGPQAKALIEKVQRLDNENRELKSALAQTKTKAEGTAQKYAKLLKQSASVIKLRKEHTRLKDEFQKQAERLDQLAAESEARRLGSSLKWFLAGAGVLVVGWFMGMAMGRRKRRWSSSL